MGLFSWMTQDTNQSIAVEGSRRRTFTAIMEDNKGNRWVENNYQGYGEFGGKDFYDLLDEMNGGVGDRMDGVVLAFSGKSFISPSLSEWGGYFGGEEPTTCPDQGYFY